MPEGAYTSSTVALPPTIPTSFVPKQPVATTRRQKSGTNVLMIIAGVIAGLSVLLALAVFGYELYLKSAREAKAAELAEAQRAVNLDVVESFIRLRDRLSTVESILDQHIMLSSFFDSLEERTLQSVRFNTLSIAVDEDRAAEIQMDGVARSFNALAAQSASIATEKRIKRAIFSDISVNDNGTVGFSLTATLDPRLITLGDAIPGDGAVAAPEAPEASAAEIPAAPEAAAATTTTTTPAP